MVKKPLAKAGDTGSIPGVGRLLMPGGSKTFVPELPALVLQLLKPGHLELMRHKRTHCNEKPVHCNKDPVQPKININK